MTTDLFVRCGDLWVRKSTVTAIEVGFVPTKGSVGHYVVKVRSTALVMARQTGPTYPTKPEAEAAAAALALTFPKEQPHGD